MCSLYSYFCSYVCSYLCLHCTTESVTFLTLKEIQKILFSKADTKIVIVNPFKPSTVSSQVLYSLYCLCYTSGRKSFKFCLICVTGVF